MRRWLLGFDFKPVVCIQLYIEVSVYIPTFCNQTEIQYVLEHHWHSPQLSKVISLNIFYIL